MSWQMADIRNISLWETSPDPAQCICGGSGWWLTPFDTWERCAYSAHVGPHPDGDYCEICHGYDCWRPRGYHGHPLQANDHPELLVSHPKREWELKMMMEKEKQRQKYNQIPF